jgi:thiosulfate reductase cytochrome b subunit
VRFCPEFDVAFTLVSGHHESMPDPVKIIEKHPLAIRWFHWLHFPILMLMIWSGLLIYWANQAYVRLPAKFVTFFGIDHNLAEGMGWHFFLMWIFAINGLAYVIYLTVSKEWRFLLPDRKAWKEAVLVTLHEMKILKTEPAIRGKFNSAQRIAYTSVILMGAGSLLTGLAIYKPVQAGWITFLLGGYQAARLEHFLLTVGFILFFIIHVTEVIRAGWNNFRAMVSGYEIVKSETVRTHANPKK